MDMLVGKHQRQKNRDEYTGTKLPTTKIDMLSSLKVDALGNHMDELTVNQENWKEVAILLPKDYQDRITFVGCPGVWRLEIGDVLFGTIPLRIARSLVLPVDWHAKHRVTHTPDPLPEFIVSHPVGSPVLDKLTHYFPTATAILFLVDWTVLIFGVDPLLRCGLEIPLSVGCYTVIHIDGYSFFPSSSPSSSTAKALPTNSEPSSDISSFVNRPSRPPGSVIEIRGPNYVAGLMTGDRLAQTVPGCIGVQVQDGHGQKWYTGTTHHALMSVGKFINLGAEARRGHFRRIVSQVYHWRGVFKASSGEKRVPKNETRSKTKTKAFEADAIKKVYWAEEDGEEVGWYERILDVDAEQTGGGMNYPLGYSHDMALIPCKPDSPAITAEATMRWREAATLPHNTPVKLLHSRWGRRVDGRTIENEWRVGIGQGVVRFKLFKDYQDADFFTKITMWRGVDSHFRDINGTSGSPMAEVGSSGELGIFGFQNLQMARVEMGEIQENLAADAATADVRRRLLETKMAFYGAFELPSGFTDDYTIV